MNVVERFWKHVHPEPNTGCWLWAGAPRGRKGYGSFWMNGRTHMAHRAAFRLMVGEITKPCVLHRCDVRSCVNPDHLFLGTKADNNRDRDLKGRMDSVLTEGDVIAIRREYTGERGQQLEIAARYGVSNRTICDLVNGHTWQHLPGIDRRSP